MKLHLGAGPQALPGWVNIDNEPYPGIDRVLDVRDGLPFEGVERIFAEHFLEHLSFEDALRLLGECRRVLRPDGILRLSTPNLDWVWLSHYRPPEELSPEHARVACFELNRAFRGWGHQFLYNPAMLTAILREAGFGEIVFCRYGCSNHPDLQGLERHPGAADLPGAPHVLVAEAFGFSKAEPSLRDLASEYLRDFGVR